MEQTSYPGLEIDHDPSLQRREWSTKRVVWWFLYGALLAIMLGAIGKGPLSSGQLMSADSTLRLEYEKFLRHRSPDALRVTLKAEADTVTLRLDNRYGQRIQVDKVTPEPERVIATDAALRFVFNTQAGATMQARIEFRPEVVGPLHGWMAIDDKPGVRFSQFVYP